MRRSRSLSLEHKLPLLMTAVLLVVLAASLVLTYQGGDITVESEVGRGSVFTVSLPSVPVSSTPVNASPRMERGTAPG